MFLVTFASAQAQQPAPKGETIATSVEAKAVVTKVDRDTREITLRTADGQERSLVAGEEVKNFAQIQPGDLVTVAYGEALAYEVKKGGSAVAPETTVAGGSAEPGARPAGIIGRQTTVTVVIAAIDRAAPTVTFTGPAGNSRTITVLHPEKLEGVNVGDTVEITYTEALAIRVEEVNRK
jgi:hypothetical protein